ncbi:MAG: hypothetical protein KDA51_03665, partial [Planctomycetales bacterium]|nr:hypothetical protein [Planctomycetales bacterium]
ALSDGGLGSLTGGEVIALVDRKFTLSFVGGANEGLAVPLDNTLLSELEYFDHTNFGGALDSDTTITVTLTMGVRAVDADSVEFFVEVGDVLTADIRLTSSLDAGDNTINTSELPQGEAWATLSLDIESLSAQLTGGTNGALTATDLGQNLSLTTSLPSQSSAAAGVFFLIDLSTGQPVDPFEAPVPIHSDWRWIVSSDGAELDPLNSPGFDESQLRPALNARIGPGEIAASPHSPIEQWRKEIYGAFSQPLVGQALANYFVSNLKNAADGFASGMDPMQTLVVNYDALLGLPNGDNLFTITLTNSGTQSGLLSINEDMATFGGEYTLVNQLPQAELPEEVTIDVALLNNRDIETGGNPIPGVDLAGQYEIDFQAVFGVDADGKQFIDTSSFATIGGQWDEALDVEFDISSNEGNYSGLVDVAGHGLVELDPSIDFT